MTQTTMYDQIVGYKSTTLTAAFTAGTDEIINVQGTYFLPDAPNTATIRDTRGSPLVTVRYTGKTATTLTGVEVVEGDSAEALTARYPSGSMLGKPLTKNDIDAIQDNIRDHLADTANPHDVTPSQIGLGSVNNTSDEDKPRSAATREYDSLLEDQININSRSIANHVERTNNPHSVTKEQVGLGNTPDGAQINVLESVKIGGTPLTILNKSVDINNVPTATALQTARKIDGVDFNGAGDAYHFGVCTTAANTAAKTVSISGYSLATGSKIIVKFNNPNRAESPTLNVNGTGAKSIRYRGEPVSPETLAQYTVQEFVYDGTGYEIVGDINNNPETLEIHGFILDESDSNPNTRVTYIKADAGKTTTEVATIYESKIRHCVIKAAIRRFYVMESNWALQEDGVTASGVDSGMDLDGNFVLEYPKIFIRATQLGADQKMYEFTWDNAGEVDGWYAPIRFDDELRDAYWTGVTEGVDQTVTISGASTVITRAVYGAFAPSVGQNSEVYWLRGFNAGKYEGLADDINTYHGVELMPLYAMQVMLDIWRYKTTDFETNVARGNVDNSTKVNVNAGVSLTGGYTQGTPGTSGGTTGCVIGGKGNIHGDIWELKDAAYLYKDFCYNTDAKHHKSIPAVTAANWSTYFNEHYHHILNLPHARNYVKSMKLSSEVPCMIPDTVGGSDATYYADYHYINTADSTTENSVARYCIAGGGWDNASIAGAFSLLLNNPAGYSNSSIGARLHAFSLT